MIRRHIQPAPTARCSQPAVDHRPGLAPVAPAGRALTERFSPHDQGIQGVHRSGQRPGARRRRHHRWRLQAHRRLDHHGHLDIVGQIIGSPNFDSVLQFKIDSGSDTYIQPGTIITALINFLLVALAVYFCIVVPMNKMKALQKKNEEEKPAEPTDVELLGEIRDLLAARAH